MEDDQFEPQSGLSPESARWWQYAVISFLLGLAAEKFLGAGIGTEVGVGLGLLFAALSFRSHRRDFLSRLKN